MFKKILTVFTVFCFASTLVVPPQARAATALNLPLPGTMVDLSPAYEPVMIKGLTVHKDNPFLFDFIVDVGQDKASGEPLKEEGQKLIKYFLASLAIPEKDLWVNLSPYEKDRTIPEELSKTDMGRDLLAQDYILKQITASLIYPEKTLGKTFWDKIYSKAQQLYGTTEISVNTFNKVWIMADKAEVFEHNNTAFVTDSHLKVMLEEDYLALQKSHVGAQFIAPTKEGSMNRTPTDVNSLGSQIVRDIILPELEKEVNTGKNFANLRQIFNSLILASWYKKNLKEALLNQVYSNQSKVKGIELKGQSSKAKDEIYRQYLQAYKKGVFNYIKEDIDASKGTTIPRKYFSGGMQIAPHDLAMTTDVNKLANVLRQGRALVNFSVGTNVNDHLEDLPVDAAMSVTRQRILMWAEDIERIRVRLEKPVTEAETQQIHDKLETVLSGLDEEAAFARTRYLATIGKMREKVLGLSARLDTLARAETVSAPTSDRAMAVPSVDAAMHSRPLDGVDQIVIRQLATIHQLPADRIIIRLRDLLRSRGIISEFFIQKANPQQLTLASEAQFGLLFPDTSRYLDSDLHSALGDARQFMEGKLDPSRVIFLKVDDQHVYFLLGALNLPILLKIADAAMTGVAKTSDRAMMSEGQRIEWARRLIQNGADPFMTFSYTERIADVIFKEGAPGKQFTSTMQILRYPLTKLRFLEAFGDLVETDITEARRLFRRWDALMPSEDRLPEDQRIKWAEDVIGKADRTLAVHVSHMADRLFNGSPRPGGQAMERLDLPNTKLQFLEKFADLATKNVTEARQFFRVLDDLIPSHDRAMAVKPAASVQIPVEVKLYINVSAGSARAEEWLPSEMVVAEIADMIDGASPQRSESGRIRAWVDRTVDRTKEQFGQAKRDPLRGLRELRDAISMTESSPDQPIASTLSSAAKRQVFLHVSSIPGYERVSSATVIALINEMIGKQASLMDETADPIRQWVKLQQQRYPGDQERQLVQLREDITRAVTAAGAPDRAMVAKGGIDLDTGKMRMNIKRDPSASPQDDGPIFKIDPAVIERIKREGIDSLTPVIFRITPVVSIWSLVGLEPPKKQEERLAGV